MNETYKDTCRGHVTPRRLILWDPTRAIDESQTEHYTDATSLHTLEFPIQLTINRKNPPTNRPFLGFSTHSCQRNMGCFKLDITNILSGMLVASHWAHPCRHGSFEAIGHWCPAHRPGRTEWSPRRRPAVRSLQRRIPLLAQLGISAAWPHGRPMENSFFPLKTMEFSWILQFHLALNNRTYDDMCKSFQGTL